VYQHTEYKFVTAKISGLNPTGGEGYFNWADVTEMLSRYGSGGWTVAHVTGTKFGDDSMLYAFVLERPLAAQQQKKPK
jgi:hypothetical protein